MPGLQLSVEICSRIVRALQREAEIKLYDSLYFGDAGRAHIACKTLSRNGRLALLVHTFWFNDESRRPAPITRHFWLLVQGALCRMHNLVVLGLFDVSYGNAWVLDPRYIKFQLHEAALHFTWDTQLVEFLEGQNKLQYLQTFDRVDDAHRVVVAPAAGSLPLLQRFDGTLTVSEYILSCPLTQLQITVEEGVLEHLLDFLSRLCNVRKTLRSLSMLDLGDDIAADALDVVASICPNLMYLGLIPLPPIHVGASSSKAHIT
ncbi:hypothetical protein H0H87_005114 [Tephrocybe sp. NHM501043]|nr:hypothetical protein H0H87_005114 [Tephrocybe sp. NHM501043]